MEVVTQSGGIYLPCREPISQVEYIIVGMEPSFNWADSIEDAEKKIAGGFRNFDSPKDAKHRLALFRRSIERYLLRPDETYHLTDLSKGAMPTVVANLDRERRWEEWYPLPSGRNRDCREARCVGHRYWHEGAAISLETWLE